MKLEREHVVDELIGEVKTNKFKIGEDSMGIIIDSLINLYSDPIGSIVREVTSNCYDAHREKDLKMKHVIPMTGEDEAEWFHPTSKKPQIEFQEENILLGIGNAFLFRDFGVGLSQKRVEEIYTLFGNSTKRDNNHQIGGFGIGAKSPFSYTDTFYIISSHNGKTFSYMLYRGNDAFHMDLLKTTETTELNSTEVIIPIKEDSSYRDIKNFVKAINNQLGYFMGLEFINIEEGTGIKAELSSIAWESDNLAISMEDDTNNDSYSSTDIHLMVGRVRYPLNEDMVDSQIFWSSNQIPCAIKFNVGELDLVPSRESVRYTDKTKQAIKNKILDIQKEMKEVCETQLSSCSDFITWINQAHAISSNNSNRWRQNYKSVFEVQVYLAKLSDKAPKCLLHKNELSLNFFKEEQRKQLFRGFTINTVTRIKDHNYIGNYRLKKTTPDVADFYSLPIYWQQGVDPTDTEATRKVFLKTKDFHLASLDDNKGFIQIRRNFSITDADIEKENNLFSSSTTRDEMTIRQDFETLSELLAGCAKEDYDSVDMTGLEDLAEEVGSFETEAERRKRLGKAFLRRIYFKDRYGERNKVSFSNDEYHMHDLEKYLDEEKGIVIYGNSADSDLLKQIAAICEQAGLYPTMSGYSSSSLDVKHYPIVILKVAEKLNKQMAKFINVKDLFTMKHPILVNWHTALKTKHSTDELFFFACFKTLNSDLHYKWSALKKNHEDNFDHFRYLSSSEQGEIRDMCESSDCINHKMLENLKELESYSKKLDLFKHLDFVQDDGKTEKPIPSKEVFLAMREYLRFKSKAVVKFKKQKKKAEDTPLLNN